MDDEATIPQPVNNEAESRFEISVAGPDADIYDAELIYERDGDRLVLVHTRVPEELEGRGVGGVLVRAAIEWAAREGLVVIPRCPFARRWLRKHRDVAELVEIDWSAASSRLDQ